MGINTVALPISRGSEAERWFGRAGSIPVGIAVDCSSQKVYWTDVAGRNLFYAPMSDSRARLTFAGSNLMSPEGVTVRHARNTK